MDIRVFRRAARPGSAAAGRELMASRHTGQGAGPSKQMGGGARAAEPPGMGPGTALSSSQLRQDSLCQQEAQHRVSAFVHTNVSGSQHWFPAEFNVPGAIFYDSLGAPPSLALCVRSCSCLGCCALVGQGQHWGEACGASFLPVLLCFCGEHKPWEAALSALKELWQMGLLQSSTLG